MIEPSSLPATPDLDRNENQLNPIKNNASLSSHSSHSTPSPIISTVDDENYWEDIAQMTYDLSSDGSEKLSNRKRSNSSTRSILSSASSPARSTDDRHRRKRNKQSTDIEIITLSSSDTSDNDDVDDDDRSS